MTSKKCEIVPVSTTASWVCRKVLGRWCGIRFACPSRRLSLCYRNPRTLVSRGSEQIDDVVDASPIHFFCGIWGLIAAGLFSSKQNYAVAYSAERVDSCAGLLYGGGMRMFAANMVFCLAVLSWVGSLSLILFVTVKLTVGIRVSKHQEIAGLDDSKHGGQTYPELRVPHQRESSSFG